MAVAEPVLDTIYITAFALSPAEEQVRQKVAGHARTAGFQVAQGPDPRIQRGAGGFVDPLKAAWEAASVLMKIYITVGCVSHRLRTKFEWAHRMESTVDWPHLWGLAEPGN